MSEKTIEVGLFTTVKYWYDDGFDYMEPDDFDKEHIYEMLEEGYVEGELWTYNIEVERDIRGWWKK